METDCEKKIQDCNYNKKGFKKTISVSQNLPFSLVYSVFIFIFTKKDFFLVFLAKKKKVKKIEMKN